MSKPINITIIDRDGQHTNIGCDPDEYILDAALDGGVIIDFECRAGSCTRCLCHLQRGSIDDSEGSLDNELRDDNYFQACITYPTSDCVIVANVEDRAVGV